MHFGSRNNKFNYSMRGKQLEAISVERYLGVVIASNLKVADHCQQAYMPQRTKCWVSSHEQSNTGTSALYGTPLQKSGSASPRVFYISIWNPHYQQDKPLLEKVQRRFTLLFDDLRPMAEIQRQLGSSQTVVLGRKTSPIRFN